MCKLLLNSEMVALWSGIDSDVTFVLSVEQIISLKYRGMTRVNSLVSLC